MVGVGGFLVQSVAVYLLVATGLPVAASAGIAVLVAVVHNFCWHVRWTWRDRHEAGTSACRLFIRFAGLNGGVSLVGNIVITSGMVAAGVPVLGANLAAVLLCSAVNFALCDRRVFVAMLVALVPAQAAFAGPDPATLVTWTEYVARAEAQIRAEAARGTAGAALTPAEWTRLKRGEALLETREARRADGRAFDVPGGLVHHWRGRVFLPGVSLDALLAELQAPTSRRWVPEEVRAMRVLARRPDGLRVFMRLERRGLVDATYDTEHEVRYIRHGSAHASSRSVSTRITEVADAGTSHEHRLPAGQDRGFLWRLNAYWRYEQRPDGVLVECDSVSLSRSVPRLVRTLAMPLITRVSRESLQRTLDALRTGFALQEDGT